MLSPISCPFGLNFGFGLCKLLYTLLKSSYLVYYSLPLPSPVLDINCIVIRLV